MGMSTHVIGLKPCDAIWHKMYEVYRLCEESHISPPKAVYDFFEGMAFSNIEVKGIEVELGACVSDYADENIGGYEIDVSKLPKDVKIIRFYNSW